MNHTQRQSQARAAAAVPTHSVGDCDPCLLLGRLELLSQVQHLTDELFLVAVDETTTSGATLPQRMSS